MDKEVVQVLDPTLLLDMDEYPYANIEEKNYCYCYFLNLGDKKNVSFDEIKRYAADENMKLIVTSPSNYTLFLNENPIFPTVEKWLGLYKNANCIFTNTYHVLIVCYGMGCGGAEKSLISFLNRLPKDRWNVDLIVANPNGMYMKQIPSTVHFLNNQYELENFATPMSLLLL